MVNQNHKLSIRSQCDLFSIHRSGLYYKPRPERPENLELMKLIDAQQLQHPSEGVLQLQDHLSDAGYHVNEKRVRRLMRKMPILPIYPKPRTTKPGDTTYIRPYFLRDLEIARTNQVWQIDITYIPMKSGFMYLTAIIDVCSRYVVNWSISNCMDADRVITVVQGSLEKHGRPEIINSDQGSQFTCEKWVQMLKDENIRISMDGKGRAIDNIYIERLWRTVKYEYIYLNPADTGLELFEGLQSFFSYYNNQKRHQRIQRRTNASLYSKSIAA